MLGEYCIHSILLAVGKLLRKLVLPLASVDYIQPSNVR